MKKIFTLILCISAGAFVARAQKPEMAKAIVKYKFSHVRDTTAKDNPYTENMVLFVGETSSAYKSFDKKMQDAMMRKQLEQQMAEQKGNAKMDFKVTSTKAVTRAEYYQFPAQNKLMRKETLISPYLIEEPIPVINWKISADTATFGTLHCQKATGYFKGRDYTAWFCPDIPLHFGPWKLNGLPGLIVEAYDTNKEVEFKFDGMEQVVATDKPAVVAETAPQLPGGGTIKFSTEDSQDPNLIAVPTNAVKTTEKEFQKLQEAMRKDPQAFIAAMGGGTTMRPVGPPTGGPTRTVLNISSGGPGTGPVTNNPIELPEKK